MIWIDNKEELIEKSISMLNMRNDGKVKEILKEMEIDIEKLSDEIMK